MSTNKLVTVASFTTPVEADLAKNELQAAGIQAWVGDQAMSAWFWHLGTAVGGAKVLVAERDLARAREVLMPLQANGKDADAARRDRRRRPDTDIDIARRACFAAILGVAFCPPLLTLYSIWLIVRHGLITKQVGPKARKLAWRAAAVDCFVMGIVTVVLLIAFTGSGTGHFGLFSRRQITDVRLLHGFDYVEDAVYQPGQCWAYHTRPGESQSTLVVLHIDFVPRIGKVVHVWIDDLRMTNPVVPGGVTDTIPHLAFTPEALDRSVTGVVQERVALPDYERFYERWKRSATELAPVRSRESGGYLPGSIPNPSDQTSIVFVPKVYSITVAEAVQEYEKRFRRTHGDTPTVSDDGAGERRAGSPSRPTGPGNSAYTRAR